MVLIHSQEEEEEELEPNSAREDVGLAGLWNYSKLELGLDRFPLHDALSFLLQRRLAFRVRIRDQQTAKLIFARAGPVIRFDALSSLIDVLFMSCEAGLDEEDTKQSCQKFDDLLFTFTAQICRANGVQLKVERKDLGEDGSNIRSDLTVFCNGCLVLCGEEREGVADMNDTIAELIPKMKCWNSQFFGELPYILGYVACGDRRELFAFRRKPMFSICEVPRRWQSRFSTIWPSS
ncbi:hypothetical protein PHYSODRAFT_501336 [Phytophthora sojae]|uniref:Uncharacterized protein n=1 Tax=Phytophthora sojae (strain P6497) TaxID=1094619 RepID=G4ZHL6_PHYSP|nr:hypothetical protein PHYSODRAFT_501336 [Phytophthora sojae]EGZ18671.1 hypothetical protein PHYSODRAFT_501336 [Phytophthora sojae]|eukprot:XP_009527729.1 hypothetical protein PHYSODRAFT_501336 [Phytophthora sojae]